MGVGWRASSLDTGVNFIGTVAQTLWYLDPHHDKFANRGIHLPDRFSAHKGYNDFKKKRSLDSLLMVYSST